MGYLLAGTTAIAAAAGFVAGMVTFKRSLVWCVACGATLRCVECPEQSSTVAQTGSPQVGADSSAGVGRASGCH